MKRIFAVFLGAAILAVSPTVAPDLTRNVAIAAGSGDDNNETVSSEPSVRKNYREAVRAVEAKDYRGAIALLNKVIDEKPRHPNALNYLGYSHRKLGDYARGVTYYKKALSLDANHKGANEYLGQAYVELGNIAGAEAQLATLERICGVDCEEYWSLRKAIKDAKARNAKQG